MKLSARDARAFLVRPDADAAGVLIYGPDPMRVAHRRAGFLDALLGPDAAAEMRLDRLEPDAVRRDPAALADALRATGFFPGARAVLVDGAGDGVARAATAALAAWQAGDACLVITAGPLPARSPLRKLFEGHPSARAAPVYADPPGRAEVAEQLDRAGLQARPAEVTEAVTALAGALDPGDFAQFVERLALYKLGDPTPLSPADIAAVAPATTEAALDDAIDMVADGRAAALPPILRRLQAQGQNPVAIAVAAGRHFRRLHAIASDPGGPAAGLARLRPPVFGPRRDRLARQVALWGQILLEDAITELTGLDLALRSAQHSPRKAMVERVLLRLAVRVERERSRVYGRRGQ
ncbi:MAG TPA: DNA polymerase III subunit delta [Rhodobacteraceae bacterium]|jgi:DNA polymerase-3 subunit delta|nr:DNA polymerase III subunit delta [Paracoccaceae bacterium]HBG97303.1 DNA polymerase III subunit delta [Paracoccaceae bacterium]